MSDAADDSHADRLQHDIEIIREDLGGLVTELDHRRHEALDVGLQVRRHAFPLAIGALALLGAAAGGFVWAAYRSRARRRLPARAARLGAAVKRMIDHPERQAPAPPSIGLKVLAAAGAAAASVVGRRLAQRMIADGALARKGERQHRARSSPTL
jgi:hypothetical protein